MQKILNNKIKNKKISFLGVTFKANTDDMRDSSSLIMIPSLSKKGAIIKYYDPTGFKKEFAKNRNVTYENSIRKTIEGSDLVIIHTEWMSSTLNIETTKKKSNCFYFFFVCKFRYFFGRLYSKYFPFFFNKMF